MMRDRLDEILAYHTGKTKEEVHRDTERDRILAARRRRWRTAWSTGS